MRRKTILIILVVLSLAVAMWYGWGFFRLAIIRATIHLPLPEWVKVFIWGWG